MAATAPPPDGEEGAATAEASPNYLALVPSDVLRCLVIPALAVAGASLAGGGAGADAAPPTTRTADAAADADAGALATAPMTARRMAVSAPTGAVEDAADADADEEVTGSDVGQPAAALHDGDDGPAGTSHADESSEVPLPPPAAATAAHGDHRPTFSIKLMLLEDEAMRSVFEGTDSDSYTDEDDDDTDGELGGGGGWHAAGGSGGGGGGTPAAAASAGGGAAAAGTSGGTSSAAAAPGWDDDDDSWVCVSDAETELYESESRGLPELVPLVGCHDAAAPTVGTSTATA